MEKKLERRKENIKRKLSKPNTAEEFRKNVDDLSNLDVRDRHYGKKRSRKLGVKVPA